MSLQQDIKTFFTMAVAGQDRDDFLSYISSSEVDNQRMNDNPHNLATRAAERVLGVMGAVSGKTIPSITETCNDLAAKVIAEDSMSPTFHYPDSVRDTAKEAWDYGLAALRKKGDTTLTEIAPKLPALF